MDTLCVLCCLYAMRRTRICLTCVFNKKVTKFSTQHLFLDHTISRTTNHRYTHGYMVCVRVLYVKCFHLLTKWFTIQPLCWGRLIYNVDVLYFFLLGVCIVSVSFDERCDFICYFSTRMKKKKTKNHMKS